MLEYFLTFLLLFIIAFSLSRLMKFHAKGTVALILLFEVVFIVVACLTMDLGSAVMDTWDKTKLLFESLWKGLKSK